MIDDMLDVDEKVETTIVDSITNYMNQSQLALQRAVDLAKNSKFSEDIKQKRITNLEKMLDEANTKLKE
jgi:hypothetical protein